MSSSVSVVIPCYRQAHFLADAIESVLGQDCPARQILVVDDGSPAGVEELTRIYSGVTYLRQDNRGLSAARNRGMSECNGDYMVFLDADDRLLPNALREGMGALDRRPNCAFVWGFNRRIDTAGTPLPNKQRVFSGGARYAELLRENIVGPPLTVMFRREALMAIGGFAPGREFAEDYELYLRLARDHESYCHEQVIAEYRIRGANMSADLGGMLRGVLEALKMQEPWVGNDFVLRRALRQGRRLAREGYDGARRLQNLITYTRSRRYVRASFCAATILALYPRMFLPLLIDRMKRLVPLVGG